MGYHYTMGAKLHHNQIVKDQATPKRRKEHRAGIEPASPRYDGGILPLEDQCLCRFSGTGENRTHIVRFKRPMHYLVCHNPKLFVVRSARKESNLQPSSYKDAALTTEPRAGGANGAAPQVGPEGIEPTPNGLKDRHAACYTTTP